MRLMSLVVRDVIEPLSFSVYGIDTLSIASVQVAHYNPKGKKAGAWHHDSSADVTVVGLRWTGRTGRFYVSGSESNVIAARDISIKVLDKIKGQ